MPPSTDSALKNWDELPSQTNKRRSVIEIVNNQPADLRKIHQLTVSCVEGGIELIDNLESSWIRLTEEGPCHEPFFQPGWIRAYIQAFSPQSTMLMISVWNGYELRGVLPLIKEHTFLGGLPVCRLRSASNLHSCRFDIVHGATDKEAVASAIWSHLVALEWDVIEIRDVPDGGAFEICAQNSTSAGNPVAIVESLKSPFLRLNQSMDLSNRGRSCRKFRSRLQKKRQRLEVALGDVKVIRETKYNSDTLAQFYELEGAGWKGRNKSAIKCSEQTRNFYTAVAADAAKNNCLCFNSLKAGDRIIAMQFGILVGNTYFVPKVGYDEKFAEYSPGQMLVGEVISEFGKSRVEKYDFLGIQAEWKRIWTDQARPHFSYFVFRAGLKGRFLHTYKFEIRRFLSQMKRHLF
jgi:CelD/BcsL family acetyltransferase involved in cellulose biosynthesis